MYSELRPCLLTHDVWDDIRLIQANTQHLTLLVNPDNTTRRRIIGCRKDGIPTDPIHVQTFPALEIIKMDEAVLCNQVNDTVLLRDLHGNWEIVCSFGGEEDLCSFLRERRIGRGVIYLDDM